MESGIESLTGLSLVSTADDFLRVKMGRVRKAAQRESSKTIGAWLRRAFIPGTSDVIRDELIKRSGNLATATNLDARQVKTIINQNRKGIALSETAGAQHALAFSGGDRDKLKKLLLDSQRGRN